MDKIEARLIHSSGPNKEAVLEIAGARYTVMDGFSWSAENMPAVGEVFDVELDTTLDDRESWEEKFSGNPKRQIGLEPAGGWSYIAKGVIRSIDPVCVDCGLLVESRAIYSNDPKVVGEYVAFRILCLAADGRKRQLQTPSPDENEPIPFQPGTFVRPSPPATIWKMEPNPYDAPPSSADGFQPQKRFTVPSQHWFLIAVVAVAIAGMIANQIAVVIVKIMKSSTSTSAP